MTDQQKLLLSNSKKQIESIRLTLIILQDYLQLLQDRVKMLSSSLNSLDTLSSAQSNELTPVEFVEADESGYEW